MNKNLLRKDLRLFWHYEEKVYPISDSVIITELWVDFWHDKGGIQMSVAATAKDFIVNFQRGHIVVRYDVVPEDSPFAGEVFCIFEDLKPSSVHIDPLTVWDPGNDQVEFQIRANCTMRWTYLAKEIKAHHEWERKSRMTIGNKDEEQKD